MFAITNSHKIRVSWDFQANKIILLVKFIINIIPWEETHIMRS
jgi:hypothetical protein